MLLYHANIDLEWISNDFGAQSKKEKKKKRLMNWIRMTYFSTAIRIPAENIGTPHYIMTAHLPRGNLLYMK